MSHRCEEGATSCTCPIHGPMWYSSRSLRHACTEPMCHHDPSLETFPTVWDKNAAKLTDEGHVVQTVETGGYL